MSDFYIRWMIRADMPSVLAVEKQAFPNAWTEDDFIRCLRMRNCIGMVCEIDEAIVGYMIYEFHKNRLHLLNFAVATEHKGTGVGTAMLAKIQQKLSPERRNRIMLEIRETNLVAQLFFKRRGFRAVSVLKDFYDDVPGEDAYLFQYRCPVEFPLSLDRR